MIIVTGSCGFIGRHLCRALRDQGEYVYEIDLFNGHDINNCELPEDDVDRVYHLAAQTNAYSRATSSDAYTNIMGSIRIFEHYRNRVVFTSTAMVNYPVNPYAISKRVCEDYARYFGVAIVRLPNVYGPGGHSLIDVCCAQKYVPVYGTGEQRRTYRHVDDVVQILLEAKPGNVEVVSGENLSVNQVVSMFHRSKIAMEAREGDLLSAIQL